MLTSHREHKIKQKLAEAAKVVRKKYKAIESERVEDGTMLDKFCKPTTKPLADIATAIFSQTSEAAPPLKIASTLILKKSKRPI